MPSSRNRKARRQQLGADKRVTASRWMGTMTVRVNVSSGSSRTGVRCKPPSFVVGSKPSNDRRVRLYRRAQEKAGYGAEKSFQPRRRRRGQRCGKKRSREGKSRSSAHPTSAPDSKPHNARRVNHKGRKYLWAVQAANRLANLRTAKLLIKNIPNIPIEVQEHISRHSVNREVLQSASVRNFSRFRSAWRGVKRRADAMGIPAVAAVHTSPWKFLAVRSSAGDWELLLAALRPPERVDEMPRHNASGLGHFWVTTRYGYVCTRCGGKLDAATNICPKSAEGLRRKETRRGSGRRGSRNGSNRFKGLF
jgi:hypothetical protein